MVLTITHTKDDTFRLYERKQFHEIRWDDSNLKIKMTTGYEHCENYRLPDFEEEFEKWKRYRKTKAIAIESLKTFAAGLTADEWEESAESALAHPDEEVPIKSSLHHLFLGLLSLRLSSL